MNIDLKVVIAIVLSVQLNFSSAASVCKTNTISPTTPTSDFTDNGDGTVTHRKTGLMWKQCREFYITNTTPCDTYSPPSSALPTWGLALRTADASTFAGYTDWRLPNIKELMTIVERQCHSPAINEAVFPGEPGGFYWTSTPDIVQPAQGEAWMVDFGTGYDARGSSISLIGSFRLVRDGI